ncbi:MAG TPA: hypothetical protein VMD04_06185 [Candidatus Margulisiibacteriota bacterium]|nr:hypothetical protein [Candidatus Margulisiibacteriota bacterium]
MRKRELVIVWVLLMLMFLELSALLSLVYFTQLPFFLFAFTVALRLLSFFLVGATALFSLLILLGIKPEITIEAWKEYVKEAVRFIGSSFILTFIAFCLCVALGALIMFILKKFYFLPSTQIFLRSLSRWVALRFY